ncbi:MAG TPA: hypothetical protein VFG29_12935 [Syntrophales bacterium]|nr:hypothetical protein [Syntrophales bacterium]
MKTLSSRIVITLIIGLFFLSSCGGTKLSNGWLNSAYEGRYLKNVLVVATSYQFDKKKLEEAFAKYFQEHGVRAVSLASITEKKKLTSEDIKADAARLGIDAIFTVRIVSINEKAVTDRFAPPPEASPDWSYSYPIYTLQTPTTTYRFEEKDIVMESDLHDVSTGKLMWRVRSETVKPGSSAKLIEEVARMVMKDLSANKLLK